MLHVLHLIKSVEICDGPAIIIHLVLGFITVSTAKLDNIFEKTLFKSIAFLQIFSHLHYSFGENWCR
jgi:type IV secretory pathway TrbL component